MSKHVKINRKIIGDGFPCYFTLELGPTHNGFESAKKLILQCSKSRADAVKFQLLNADKLIADKNYSIEFKTLSKKSNKLIKKKENVYNIFKKRFLDYDEIRELKKISDKNKLDFFLTVTDENDLEFIKELNCPSIKISSSDVNYHQLIKKAAKLNKPIQLDTGNSTIDEIKESIKIIKDQKNSNIIIHYCPTGYPTNSDSLNLNYISFLKKKFKLPIGFSDHSVKEKTCHMSLFFGANLIEKTVSQNLFSNRIEHSMSISDQEVKSFIESLKDTEAHFNKKIIFLTNREIDKRKKHRRSAYLSVNLKKGEILKIDHINFKRPGIGIQPDKIEKFLGKKTRYKLRKDSLIKPYYFKK